MGDVLVGVRQWGIQANAGRLVGTCASLCLDEFTWHRWKGRRKRKRGKKKKRKFCSIHCFIFPFHPNSFSAFFWLEKAVGLGRRWSPPGGAHAWVNGWRGQKSRSGLLEFSFGVANSRKNTRFAMSWDIWFSRFSAPAYLWRKFVFAKLVTADPAATTPNDAFWDYAH